MEIITKQLTSNSDIYAIDVKLEDGRMVYISLSISQGENEVIPTIICDVLEDDSDNITEKEREEVIKFVKENY